ncbi:MAG: hypothetical protein RLZZ401_946, partial [Pseudomonadota bacterium]
MCREYPQTGASAHMPGMQTRRTVLQNAPYGVEGTEDHNSISRVCCGYSGVQGGLR